MYVCECECNLPECCPGIIMTSTKILATRPNASIERHFGTAREVAIVRRRLGRLLAKRGAQCQRTKDPIEERLNRAATETECLNVCVSVCMSVSSGYEYCSLYAANYSFKSSFIIIIIFLLLPLMYLWSSSVGLLCVCACASVCVCTWHFRRRRWQLIEWLVMRWRWPSSVIVLLYSCSTGIAL